jgi:hypothetical protein
MANKERFWKTVCPRKQKFQRKVTDLIHVHWPEFPLLGINCIPEILVICEETKII